MSGATQGQMNGQIENQENNPVESRQGDEILLGKITSIFGVKGWVKVYSYTDPMENLLKYSSWQVLHNGQRRNFRKLDGKRHGKGLIARLEGIETPEAARLLAGAEILLSRSELPDLPQGEYYWSQLVGLDVYNQQGQFYGKVDYLLETGANDVLVVKPCTGSLDQEDRLIPWRMPEVVRQVDLEAGRLEVDWDADF
ncbi:ribosome maturation factor RimM [Marinospirillum alkaliphilum]|uniref:Ribosome maturation factor RimM n=1 Tax=Marinospirillum alkaliphilum DSM 21637 TaxID=1122209 RepID=A0A1K1VWH5_9GAMM|nr:ribosome maturation factor RimM [Marinospirillum alkaliphilum]SFX29359.1 16S rRNA processing protein RimM [Marinospirillum alkaliphilum DSM 21637]